MTGTGRRPDASAHDIAHRLALRAPCFTASLIVAAAPLGTELSLSLWASGRHGGELGALWPDDRQMRGLDGRGWSASEKGGKGLNHNLQKKTKN